MPSNVEVFNPCRRCTKETGRHLGCHSKCELYSTYRKRLDEYHDKEKRARDVLNYILNYEYATLKHKKR